MKKHLIAIFAFLLLQMPLAAHAEHFQAVGTADVYFSQRGGATAAALSEILVQSYSFNSAQMAKSRVLDLWN